MSNVSPPASRPATPPTSSEHDRQRRFDGKLAILGAVVIIASSALGAAGGYFTSREQIDSQSEVLDRQANEATSSFLRAERRRAYVSFLAADREFADTYGVIAILVTSDPPANATRLRARAATLSDQHDAVRDSFLEVDFLASEDVRQLATDLVHADLDLIVSYSEFSQDRPDDFGTAYGELLYTHEELRRDLIEAVRVELGISAT
jgi:hypothetical protein